MKKIWAVFVACFAVSISAAVANAQQACEPGPINFDKPPASLEEAKQQMTRMIAEDYAYWTNGGQRKLTIDDIGHLQKQSRLRGGQAALIGSLALALDWRHGLVDAIGKDELLALAEGKAVPLQTSNRYNHKAHPDEVHIKDWPLEYQKEFANVASNVTPRGLSLWGADGGPSVRDIHQGQIGDCYFVSGVEAVVLKKPELIKRAIEQTGPDTFELHFPSRDEPMHITLTEADMAQFNTDRSGGCWLAVLGKAESRIREERKQKNQFYKQTDLGEVSFGGSQCQVIHLLTGHHYEPVHLKRASEERVRDILAEAMRRGVPVGLTSKDHTLSIKAFNPDSGSVLVLNPWGTSDKFKLPNSDEHVQMQGGFFEIPLAQLHHCFATINVPKSMAR
jgi:hypothetical protein